jgi:hypothetical protein
MLSDESIIGRCAAIEVAGFDSSGSGFAMAPTRFARIPISIHTMLMHLAVRDAPKGATATLHYAALLATRLAPSADAIDGSGKLISTSRADPWFGMRSVLLAPTAAIHLGFAALSRCEGISTTKALPSYGCILGLHREPPAFVV